MKKLATFIISTLFISNVFAGWYTDIAAIDHQDIESCVLESINKALVQGAERIDRGLSTEDINMTYKQHASGRTPILTFLDDSNKDFALRVIDESIKLNKVWSFIKNKSHNLEDSVFNRYSFKVENIKTGDKYNGVITLDINDWSGAYSCTPYTNKDKFGAFLLKKRKVVYSLP